MIIINNKFYGANTIFEDNFNNLPITVRSSI